MNKIFAYCIMCTNWVERGQNEGQTHFALGGQTFREKDDTLALMVGSSYICNGPNTCWCSKVQEAGHPLYPQPCGPHGCHGCFSAEIQEGCTFLRLQPWVVADRAALMLGWGGQEVTWVLLSGTTLDWEPLPLTPQPQTATLLLFPLSSWKFLSEEVMLPTATLPCHL